MVEAFGVALIAIVIVVGYVALMCAIFGEPTPAARVTGADQGAALTDDERADLLRAWPWPKEAATTETGFADVCAAVERIVAAARADERTKALTNALATIRTHNDQPLSPENLRWAATHEALCRSFIFDVLQGLADALAREGGDR